MAKQVLYRRGTTAEHATFTGANGEITVDTVKHVVIVHDGRTAGGFELANASLINSSISTLTANAATQATAITTLTANAATQASVLTTLLANATVQQASIDAFIAASNATVIFANIADVRGNLLAAHSNIALLWGNATVQSEAITLANANIAVLQSTVANIATITPNVAAIASSSNFTIPSSMTTLLVDTTTGYGNIFLPNVTTNGHAVSICLSPVDSGVPNGGSYIISNTAIINRLGTSSLPSSTTIRQSSISFKFMYYNGNWWPLVTP